MGHIDGDVIKDVGTVLRGSGTSKLEGVFASISQDNLYKEGELEVASLVEKIKMQRFWKPELDAARKAVRVKLSGVFNSNHESVISCIQDMRTEVW